jgi:hypothetical protein
MTESQLTLIISIGGGLLGVVIGFLLNVWNSNRIENKRRRNEALEYHFDDISGKIISNISGMARSLCINNNRLVFGGYAPVQEKYDFEKEEEYKSFEIHFPELASEWIRLKGNAIKASEKSENNIKLLQDEFGKYAIKLSDTTRNIQKYGIGTVFKRNKKCPICKKF